MTKKTQIRELQEMQNIVLSLTGSSIQVRNVKKLNLILAQQVDCIALHISQAWKQNRAKPS